MPLDRFEASRIKPTAVATPVAAQRVKATAGAEGSAPRTEVDVAKFRIMPLAGAPQVSAAVDETLGKTGLLPFILSKVEAFGNLGLKAANGIRFLTRVLGPAAFTFSAFWNFRLLGKALKDPALGGREKATLAIGTVATTLGALTAIVAALPARVAGLLRLGVSHQVLANKASGIAGGIAGLGFAAINMVETLRNPRSQAGEKFFAKAGFGIGVIGFVFGTTALLLSMGAGAGVASALPWLLPVASKVATFAGLAGLASWIGQMVLGKNTWLNAKLAGTPLA